MEFAQFFSISLKPNVLGVWLANGGRKRSKSTKVQLIIHSARHGTNITSIELDKVSIFQTMGEAQHKNFGYKMGLKFEKVSCIV